MRKIYNSAQKRPINIILLVCVIGLYFVNNHYLKAHTMGNIRLFFICYFNDLMCPLFFFSYANLLLITVNKELHRFWSIIAVGICTSLVWEFFAPLIKPSSTTDLVDIICYMSGSVIYWAILHFMRKKDT